MIESWTGLSPSDKFSAISLLVTVVGVIVALVTLRESSKNASASTVAALVCGFSEAWRNVLTSEGVSVFDFSLHELFNVLELACGVESQGSLIGNSGKLARQFIFDTIDVLGKNADAKRQFLAAMQNADDFEYIRSFQDRYPTRPKR